jgi:hypothetical protein
MAALDANAPGFLEVPWVWPQGPPGYSYYELKLHQGGSIPKRVTQTWERLGTVMNTKEPLDFMLPYMKAGCSAWVTETQDMSLGTYCPTSVILYRVDALKWIQSSTRQQLKGSCLVSEADCTIAESRLKGLSEEGCELYWRLAACTTVMLLQAIWSGSSRLL